MHRPRFGNVLAFATYLICGGGLPMLTHTDVCRGEDEHLRLEAEWDWPGVDIYEQHLLSYLDQVQADEQLRSQVFDFWNDSEAANRGPAFLDRLLSTAELVDPRFAPIRRRLTNFNSPPMQPGDIPWMESDAPGWLQDAVRLACGRSLAQRKLYDESLETLAGLSLSQACDPSTLLFYRAVCEHHLLEKEACVASLESLLARESELPSRYVSLASLMLGDINSVKEDSLDEVSRMMLDVQRRLELGRLGSRVRGEEDKIVDKLGKMIEDIEKQIQEQQQQQNQNQNQNQSGKNQRQQGQLRPAEESRIGGETGPGDVENKD
ncbi:MAG TPA: hypothetical protein DDW52_20220, partial [Planctomycetaceae bacterium]|nr:hypothetical protein [Planctomycetaceae bacterium]